MRDYIPSSISPSCARLKGLKLEQWISTTFVASSSCRRTRVDDPRATRNAAFSSTAEISRSIAVLSFFFPLPFSFLFFCIPDLGSVIGRPCSFCSFVRFEFVRSSELSSRSRRAHTRLLILFPVFPLARFYELPCDLLFRFISISVCWRVDFRGETLL